MSLRDWLNPFRRKVPEKPPENKGHRGIAVGLGPEPDHDTLPDRTINRQEVGTDEVREFLEEGAPLFVYSSNVGMAQYYPDDEKMMVEFLNGYAYVYSNVSAAEALDFAKAHSKGIWVWDHLRGRGPKGTPPKKPYVRIK